MKCYVLSREAAAIYKIKLKSATELCWPGGSPIKVLLLTLVGNYLSLTSAQQ